MDKGQQLDPMRDITEAIPVLQKMLQAKAKEQTRVWWEKYLRGVIPFRGVGIPDIRTILEQWRGSAGIDSLSEQEQLKIALELFDRELAEDKLAGILYLQNYLGDKLPWEMLFKEYESLFDRNLIFDWNTCDWFCVRVLGPALNADGKPVANILGQWSKSDNLWKARSSAVPFIRVADTSKFYLDINCICTRLIKRPERFAKTAVGWVLREVSKHDEDFVIAFLNDHIKDFTPEAIKNAAKYFKKEHRLDFVAKVKAARKVSLVER